MHPGPGRYRPSWGWRSRQDGHRHDPAGHDGGTSPRTTDDIWRSGSRRCWPRPPPHL